MSEPSSRKHGARAVLALLLCLASPFAWMLTLDVHWMRTTGFAGWAFLALGLALGWSAVRADQRLRTRILFVLDVAMLVLFAFTSFVAARLPPSERAQTLARAPDFTLPDQNGRATNLVDELGRGPVLLVFYRGHW